MALAALTVSIAAIVVALVSVSYTRRQTLVGERQLAIVREQDHRARTPRIAIDLPAKCDVADSSVVYTLRNEGPHDLDSVIVEWPKVSGNLEYPVAALGHRFGDVADLGLIEVGDSKGFVLSIGSAERLPEFRVRVVCRRRDEEPWEITVKLEDPRFHIQLF